MFSYPILAVWQACWPPVIIKICNTFPLTGPGGDQFLTPSSQLFLLLQQYIYTSFTRSVQNMYVLCYTRICSHSWDVKRKEKYLFNMRGWAGPAPCPLPPLRWRSRGGGGEGWRAMSCLGILSGEGGISGKQAASWNGRFFWQVNSADYSRGCIRQIFTPRYFGGSFWRIYLAGHFGTFIWRVFVSNEKASCWAKEEKAKEMYNQWICRLHNVIIY